MRDGIGQLRISCDKSLAFKLTQNTSVYYPKSYVSAIPVWEWFIVTTCSTDVLYL